VPSDVSFLQNIQTSSETQSASSSVGAGDKTAGASDIDHSHPSGGQVEGHFVSTPLICLYGVDGNTFILLNYVDLKFGLTWDQVV